MAARGATIAEMDDACSVDTRTFYRWMNKYPELSEAVSAGFTTLAAMHRA